MLGAMHLYLNCCSRGPSQAPQLLISPVPEVSLAPTPGHVCDKVCRQSIPELHKDVTQTQVHRDAHFAGLPCC